MKIFNLDLKTAIALFSAIIVTLETMLGFSAGVFSIGTEFQNVHMQLQHINQRLTTLERRLNP